MESMYVISEQNIQDDELSSDINSATVICILCFGNFEQCQLQETDLAVSSWCVELFKQRPLDKCCTAGFSMRLFGGLNHFLVSAVFLITSQILC